jgi:type I restriction enzyme S subunit
VTTTLPWAPGLDPAYPIRNIRQVAQMRTGHTPSRAKQEYWENLSIPWFTLADVWQLRNGQRYLGETKELISPLGLANSAAELLPAGTVVLSRTASVGFTGIMPSPMATSQDFWNWVCGPKMLPVFLWYQMRAMRSEFDRLKSGSTHKTIYQSDAAGLRVLVPPIEAQRQIVAYLDYETAEIDAFIADLEEARCVSVERVTSQLWSLTSPRRGIDGVEQPLGTLASFVAGGTPDSNNLNYWSEDGTGVPWVAISDMSRRERVRHTSKHVTSSGMAAAGLRLLAPGTILLAMYASVGEVARLEVSAVTNQAILGITPGRDLNGDYLMAHLRSRQAALVAEARSNTQANLNAHQVRHLKLWRPSRAAQDRIANEITAEEIRHRAQLADIDAALALAKERRAALITAAVTGQIDVTTKQLPAVDSIQTAIEEAR